MQKTASKMAFLAVFIGFLEEKFGCLRLRFESMRLSQKRYTIDYQLVR